MKKKGVIFFALFFSVFACVGQGQDSLLKGVIKRLPLDGKYDFVKERDSEGRITIIKNQKYGMLDRNLREVAPCIYDEQIFFQNGYAKVKCEGKLGLLDSGFKVVLPCIYNQLYLRGDFDFGDSAIPVMIDGKWGRLDYNGKVVTPIVYDDIQTINGNNHVSLRLGDSSCIIDRHNKTLLPWRYGTFEENGYSDIFIFKSPDRTYAVLDTFGREIIPLGKYRIEPFRSNKNVLIVSSYVKWGVIDKQGKILVPLIYDGVFTSSNYDSVDNYFVVELNKKRGLVDIKGNLIIPFLYNNIKFLKEGLYAVEYWKDGVDKWGCINDNKDTVIPFEYDDIMVYSNGLIAVEKERKWGYINLINEVVVPFVYVYFHRFSDGIAEYKIYDPGRNRPRKYVDTLGRIFRKYPEKGKYKSVSSFSEGMAVVSDEEGYFGFLNKQGKEVIPCVYEYARDFHDGFALTKSDGKFGFINKKAEKVINATYDYAEDFSSGLALVKSKSGFGYINSKAENVILCLYEDGGSFNRRFASVKKTNKWGLIDRSGKVVINFRYDNEIKFSEGLAPVLQNGKWSYIDTLGKSIITLNDTLSDCGSFFDGLAAVAGSSKFGLINKKGKLVLPTELDYIGDFVNGVSSYLVSGETDFGEDNRYGIIDYTGKKVTRAIFREVFFSSKSDMIVVSGTFGYGIVTKKGVQLVPCVYEEIYADYSGSGLFSAKLNGKWGFLNVLGKQAIPHIYDDALPFYEGMAAVKKSGKWGYIDKKGKELFWFKPCIGDKTGKQVILVK